MKQFVGSVMGNGNGGKSAECFLSEVNRWIEEMTHGPEKVDCDDPRALVVGIMQSAAEILRLADMSGQQREDIVPACLAIASSAYFVCANQDKL